MKNIILYSVVFIFLLSCLADSQSSKVHSVNYSMSITGQYDSLGRRIGSWEYKDENGMLIKRVSYATHDIYSVLYLDSGRAIHLETYRRGKLEKRVSFGGCSSELERGESLYGNCQGCHTIFEDSISFAKMNRVDTFKLNPMYFEKFLKQDEFHKNMMYTEDIECLIKYIKYSLEPKP